MTSPQDALDRRLQAVLQAEEPQVNALMQQARLIARCLDGEVWVGPRNSKGKPRYGQNGRLWKPNGGLLECHVGRGGFYGYLGGIHKAFKDGELTPTARLFIQDFPVLFREATEALNRRALQTDVRSAFALEMAESLLGTVRLETPEGNARLAEIRQELLAGDEIGAGRETLKAQSPIVRGAISVGRAIRDGLGPGASSVGR